MDTKNIVLPAVTAQAQATVTASDRLAIWFRCCLRLGFSSNWCRPQTPYHGIAAAAAAIMATDAGSLHGLA
jgi:hypothetical protein